MDIDTCITAILGVCVNQFDVILIFATSPHHHPRTNSRSIKRQACMPQTSYLTSGHHSSPYFERPRVLTLVGESVRSFMVLRLSSAGSMVPYEHEGAHALVLSSLSDEVLDLVARAHHQCLVVLGDLYPEKPQEYSLQKPDLDQKEN